MRGPVSFAVACPTANRQYSLSLEPAYPALFSFGLGALGRLLFVTRSAARRDFSRPVFRLVRLPSF